MANSLERWFENRRVNPFREFSRMEENFDRLFNEMTNMKKGTGGEIAEFSPSCDISEDAANYTLKFDLPGVPKEQVHVEVNGDQLTVRAERREEKKTDDKKKHLSEIFYGSYSRSFTLPAPMDDKKVNAKFENGVLTIQVPKTEALKSKQVLIQ